MVTLMENQMASDAFRIFNIESKFAMKYHKYIIFLLPALSFLLWSISILQAKDVVIGDYGLFSVLPLTYYAAVFLLLASMFYTMFGPKQENHKIQIYSLIFQSFLLMVFILFTPSLIEGFARSPHSWSKYSYVDYIVRNGHINRFFGYYHNTPIMFIFSAELVLLTGFDPFSFPLVFPLIMDVVLFSFIMLFCFSFFNDLRLRFMAIALFFLITWENQFHFVPQMFGFVLMILTIYLITFYWKKVNIKFILITGMLIVILIFTHLLTGFVVCAYLGLTITYQTLWARAEQNIKRKRKRNIKAKWLLNKRFWRAYWKKVLSKKVKWLLAQRVFVYSVLLGIVILAIWLYFAGDWVSRFGWSFSFSTITSLASGYIDKLYSGSEAHGNLVLLRMIFSAIIAILAIIGGKMAYDRGQTRTMYLFIISGVIPIFLFYYGVEIVQRAFLFSGLPLAIMLSMGMNKKKFLALIIAFCFLAVPVHIMAHYGNEKIDYTPPSEIAGADYLFNNVEGGFIIFGTSAIRSQYSENFSILSIDYYLEHPEIEEDVYLIYTTSSENFLEWYYDDIAELERINQIIQENEFNIILSTPDCTIYKLN